MSIARAGGMAQVVECLPSSNPHTAKNKNKNKDVIATIYCYRPLSAWY
jgi:hypothetical protein